jgi:hypothetical protein
VAIALFAVLRGAYCVIWSGDPLNAVAELTAILTPSFWFGAHLLWRIGVEWRAQHFGEREEEIRLVYGPARSSRKFAINMNRDQGNVLLATAVALGFGVSQVDLFFWMITNMTVFGVGWVYRRRQTLLALSRESHVNLQLFWFLAVMVMLFLIGCIGVAVERAKVTPWRCAFGFAGSIAVLGLYSHFNRRLRTDSPAPVLWPEWFHSKSMQGFLAITFSAMVLLLAMKGIFSSIFVFILAASLPKEIAEGWSTPHSGRRRSVATTVVLLILALALFRWVGKPVGFESAAWLGLAFGVLDTIAKLSSLPQPIPLRRPPLAVCTLGLLGLSLASFLAPDRIGLLTRVNAFPGIYEARSILGIFPQAITSDPGQQLLEGYARAGLYGDGVEYLDSLASRFGTNQPAAFKAKCLTAELKRRAGQIGQAGLLYRDLSIEYSLGPAAAWHVAGPFPEVTNSLASPSTPVSLPEPAAPWRPGSELTSLFPGHLNLQPGSRIGSAMLARLNLISPEEQPVELRFGIGGEARVWLNGGEVLRVKHQTILNLDNAIARTTLRSGTNSILVQLRPRGEQNGLVLRVTDAQGRAVAGLRWE